MRAWRTYPTGEPEQVMRLEDIPAPEPGPGELRLTVSAAGLGLPDYMMCTDQYPGTPGQKPFTSGQEVVGIVSKCGPGTKTPIGTRVMGMTDFWSGRGSLAEECIVHEDEVNVAPDFISDSDAASFRVAYHTAWLGVIRNGRAKPGETLLVLGASGGTGAAAIQLGKVMGMRVIAVASPGEKTKYCQELGADMVIDRTTQNVPQTVLKLTDGAGADIIYDPVGGELGDEAIQAIALEGRFVFIGFAAGRWAQFQAWQTMLKNCSLVGAYAGRSFPESVHTGIHNELMKLYAEGKVRSMTSGSVRFEDAPKAIAALPKSSQIGRTVVMIK
jgi:NADPH:quinone reductase